MAGVGCKFVVACGVPTFDRYPVRINRAGTGELTGYIGVTEAKLPKEFHLSKVITFPKKTA